ncbi:acyl carrier protein [Plantactinospora soyae]|uniref:Acyl carrier protein n=1 Tax=Plantactinospora soyae TaxID=1544732 RepID=A0A927R788_9ACTN|nr:acyl carrier protein [Plantactinospora soyae]MBE1489194.1 acyl carrier protein [Plantactinospora soyae]
MSTDHYTHVLEVLTKYVSVRLLGEDDAADLTEQTPLLELGVLNSIETSRLVAYIRETFGVRLPPTSMTAGNFRDLRTIAGLVVSHQPNTSDTVGAVAPASTNGGPRG